jgi:hypothetical protein
MGSVKQRALLVRLWVVLLVATVAGSVAMYLAEDGTHSASLGWSGGFFPGGGAVTQSVSYGPVSRASDSACGLLTPGQITAVVGPSVGRPDGGRIPGMAGDTCIYVLEGGSLFVDRFTGMDEQQFQDRTFLMARGGFRWIIGFGPVVGKSVSVTGVGDQAVGWPANGVVAFRQGSVVVVIAVLGKPGLATATTLARDAATAAAR